MTNRHPPASVVAGTAVTPMMAAVVYSTIAKALNAPVHTLTHAGWGHTTESALKLERDLHSFVHRSDRSDGKPRVLVGHSQGGIAALLVAQRRPDLVAGVIALAAPIHGTVLARPWLPVPAVRCMTMGSRLLGTISVPDRSSCRVINVVGTRDALVFPGSSGLLGGAEHFAVDAGHLGLILDPKIVDFIAGLVAEGPWPDLSIPHPSAPPPHGRGLKRNASRRATKCARGRHSYK